MELITQFLQAGISNIVPLIILLGLLIFVHELGHFLVAKFFNVKVEVFSLGFGKKIFSFQHGETTYCISLIPLGGYVKMYGDDPSMEVPPEFKERAFNTKPVSQRIAVVLAGPLMNLFFAMLLFFIVAYTGETVRGPVLGDIPKDSDAYNAGFRPGDKIASIGGQPIRAWREIFTQIKERPEQPLVFKIERDGMEQELRATPSKEANSDILTLTEFVGKIHGLSPISRSSTVGVSDVESLSYKAGLRSGDQITHINDMDIRFWRELEPTLSKLLTQAVPIRIRVDRKIGEQKSTFHNFTIEGAAKADSSSSLSFLGIESPEIFLEATQEKSPAQKAGLKRADRILTINGAPIASWDDVIKNVSSYKKGDKDITFEVLREGQKKTLNIKPKLTSHMNENGAEIDRFTVGIYPMIFNQYPKKITVKEEQIGQAAIVGITRSFEVTGLTVMSFVRLFQAKISPKNIGGVISIGKAARDTFQMGFSQFLLMMALISINLFILNLLPIPILDGGHLVFFTVEALRGAPISMKRMEAFQQIGLIILMSLMGLALFNDLTRVINF